MNSCIILVYEKNCFRLVWVRSTWVSPPFSSLPNDKILDQPKLKAFADGNRDVVEIMISLLDRVENTVGKGENAGYQHCLLFPQCFPKLSSLVSLKVGIVR